MSLLLAMDLTFNLPPGCATWRSVGGSSAWSDEQHSLVALIDVARVANWQRTEDGSKGRNRPDPLPRPTLVADGTATVDRGAEAEARAQRFLARQEERRRAAAGVAPEEVDGGG